MIERLWRSLKYECVYLRELETGSELRQALAWWINFYNNRRPHKTFDGRKPMEIYQQFKSEPPKGKAGKGSIGSTFQATRNGDFTGYLPSVLKGK